MCMVCQVKFGLTFRLFILLQVKCKVTLSQIVFSRKDGSFFSPHINEVVNDHLAPLFTCTYKKSYFPPGSRLPITSTGRETW